MLDKFKDAEVVEAASAGASSASAPSASDPWRSTAFVYAHSDRRPVSYPVEHLTG